MKLDLADALRNGRAREAQQTDARILQAIDDAFDSGSIEWVDARVALATSYSDWEKLDAALPLASATVASLDPAAANQAIVRALIGLGEVQIDARRWKDSESTTDRLVEFCRHPPPHVSTFEDPYDECTFARYRIADLYLAAGAYRKSVAEYLGWRSVDDDPADRRSGILELTVVGRSYARYGAYPEALFYFQRCVDETRAQYAAGDAPPAMRQVAETPEGDAEVFTVDSPHSFESQEPRCMEDLIEVRRALGDEREAQTLEQRRRQLWSAGPDLETPLIERVQQADDKWNDDYNTSYDVNVLASYYAGKGRTEDAIRTYQQGIDLIDRGFAKHGVFTDGYPSWTLTDELLGLAAQYEKAGHPDLSVPAYARAIEVIEQRLHPAHRWRLIALAGYARTLSASGRNSDSVVAWKHYLAVATEVRGATHADYATGLEGLALASERSGDVREARALRDRAQSVRRTYAREVAAARNLPVPVALRPAVPPAN